MRKTERYCSVSLLRGNYVSDHRTARVLTTLFVDERMKGRLFFLAEQKAFPSNKAHMRKNEAG